MAITPAMRTEVTQLYVSLFGRAPEAAGLGYWVTQLDQGTSLTQVAQDMYNVDAARAYYPSFLTNQEIIERFYVNVLGREADAEGLAYWTAELDAGKTQGQVIVNMVNAVVAYSGTDAAALASQALFNNKVTVGLHYAVEMQGADTNNNILDAVTADAASVEAATGAAAAQGVTQSLTTGVDDLGGTPGNDSFMANLAGNADTLNSGDMVAGGAGSDRMHITMGDDSNFAVLPTITGVEHFVVQAQDMNGGDAGENNVANQGAVQMDFQRVTGWNAGELVLENNNSRADLVIEDVRLLDSEITADATIVMRQTDSGNVDYAVYFDQHSLRAAPATESGAVLNLELMDTRSAAAGEAPLATSPFNGFAFTLNGTAYTLQTAAIGDATTYAQLLAAVQEAIAANEALAGTVTAAISGDFNAFDTDSGTPVTGSVITLTNNGAGAFAAGSYVTADGTTPASGGYHTVQTTTAGTETANLITSTIVLDDVGRGSMGGDLLIGGLSTGVTSDSQGVERFDITVQRSSELQNINSTNNTLQEVYIVNDAAFSGGLTAVGNNPEGTPGATGNLASAVPSNGDQTSQAAFNDVRVLDGSAMRGALDLSAYLSQAVVGKYLDRQDDAADATADNVNFTYSLGTNDDSLQLAIDFANLNAAGTGTREDFNLNVTGGAGDDEIELFVWNPAGGGALAANGNWYTNQAINANLAVDGGTGNDTIRTFGAGDVDISGGAGDDSIYTDNAGQREVYAFNAANVVNNDLVSNTAATTSGVNLRLTVTFKGLTSTVDVGTTMGALSNQTVSDLTINQAIKDAINNDSVLSKLLSADDGPARTLVVTSLIDGVMADGANGDLDVSFATTALTTGQGGLNLVDTANALFARYTTSTSIVDGNDSTFASDNTVTGGEGDDVIVLGTDGAANPAEASNDTVVYDAAFGNDVVVNFEAGTGAGADVLDFRALLDADTVTTLDNAIDAMVNSEVDIVAETAANDTVAEIKALYDAVDTAAATTQLLVTHDAANVGNVYQIVDGTGANDVTVTLLGTIDLADTGWDTLVASNLA